VLPDGTDLAPAHALHRVCITCAPCGARLIPAIGSLCACRTAAGTNPRHFACARPDAGECATKETAMIELTLPTMTCGHCVKAVTATVHQVDAAATLQVDLPTHQVRIESTHPAEDFRRALAEEGYASA
jgi:copper chaperone